MITTILIFQIALLLASVVALGISIRSWKYKNLPGGGYFILLMFGVAWWSLMDGISPWAETIEQKASIAQLSYVGIISTPIFFFSFVYQYAGIRLSEYNFLKFSLYILGLVILILALTNTWHHLLYKEYHYTPGNYGPTFVYGPLFWTWVGCTYLLLLLSTITLIRTAVTSSKLFRSQIVLLLIGAVLPWVGNIIYLLGWTPIEGFDLTPLAFVGVGAVSFSAVFQKKLFEVFPVAYATLFQSMSDAAFLLTPDYRIIEANKSAIELLDHQDWKGVSIERFIEDLPAKKRNDLLIFLKSVQIDDNKTDNRLELEVVLPTGESMWLAISASRIVQRTSDDYSLLVTLREITESRINQIRIARNATELERVNTIAQELLQEGTWERKMRYILKSTHEGFNTRYSFIWSVEDRDIHVRSQPNIIVSAEILDLMSTVNFTDAIERQNSNLLAGETIEIEDKDRGIFIVGFPFMKHMKVWGMWTHVWMDYKPDMPSIRALKLMADLLGAAITREEYFNETLRAKEEAIKASKAKTEFLSMMSHEIRTPLNAIMGISNIIDPNERGEEIEGQIASLKYASKHLKSLVDDVLDFSKIEGGFLELNIKEIHIDELIKPIVNSYRDWATEKGLKLILDWQAPKNAVLNVDPLRITQVLNNLLNNAIKYTDEGEVCLCVVELPENNLRFVVKDTGVGISEKDQRRIFEEFTQAYMGNDREHSGTGLGLSISQELLKLMNSELFVRSELGKGSEFYFDLKDVILKINEDYTENVIQEPNKLSGNILIVEDNNINMAIVRTLMKKWGITAHEASNGQEAVDKVKEGAFDIVLMDLQMPVMDGYEATRLIREINAEVPIIALTASAMIDTLERAKEAGMNDFVTKPFQPDELRQKLETFLIK